MYLIGLDVQFFCSRKSAVPNVITMVNIQATLSLVISCVPYRAFRQIFIHVWKPRNALPVLQPFAISTHMFLSSSATVSQVQQNLRVTIIFRTLVYCKICYKLSKFLVQSWQNVNKMIKSWNIVFYWLKVQIGRPLVECVEDKRIYVYCYRFN